MDLTEIKRIIKEHYEQRCAKKLGNLEKMDKFLEKKCKLPAVNQKEIKSE